MSNKVSSKLNIDVIEEHSIPIEKLDIKDKLDLTVSNRIYLSNEKDTEIILGDDSEDSNFSIVLNAGEDEDYGTGYIHLNCADAYLNNKSIATKYWTNLAINKLVKRIQELEDYIMKNIPCPYDEECTFENCYEEECLYEYFDPDNCYPDEDGDGLEDDYNDNCIGDADGDNFCDEDYDGDNYPDESF